MKDLGTLVLRIVAGGLLAGHGSQKLFGWFKGPGLEGTTDMMESMGMRPPEKWASIAGISEFKGGVLTVTGLAHPIGPILMLAPMATAIRKMHWKWPVWATEGGAELPVTNTAVAISLLSSGPGRYSLDHLLGIRVPRIFSLLAAVAVVAGIVLGEKKTLPFFEESSEPQQASERQAAAQ